MNRFKVITSFTLAFLILFGVMDVNKTEAKTVYWGNMALVEGQIGKITILKPIKLWKRDSHNNLVYVKGLYPKQEFRVYGYSEDYFGQYYVGGGCFITNMKDYIKYEEIPSSLKNELNGTPAASAWYENNLVKGQIGKITILKPIKLWKRDEQNNLVYVKGLYPNHVYRVYGYSEDYLGQYYVGGGCFITNMKGYIRYDAVPQSYLDQLDSTPTTPEPGSASGNTYSAIAIKAQNDYKESGYNYHGSMMESYDSNGKYFNATVKNYGFNKEIMTMDENGIIMVKYNGKYEYNPVTLAQYALANYGSYLDTKDDVYKDTFLKYAQALINIQGEDGAFRYNFAWSKFQPGWVSSMAQGDALSVFARAYHLTNNSKYLYYGNKAFRFMNTPISRGGTLTTLEPLNSKYKGQNYFWYEEYVTTPNSYTLNGFMFSLIGIYDWSMVQSDVDMGQSAAKRMFDLGIKSLVEVLPLYDVNGFSSYDLTGIMLKRTPYVTARYHAVHIYELYTLYLLTNNPVLLNYHKLWASYVNQ